MQKIFFFILCFITTTVFGQQAFIGDTVNNKTANNNAASENVHTLDMMRLYNGREYIGYPPVIKKAAYFLSDYWTYGSVDYDGLVYQNIPLMYDLIKDVLITRYMDSITSISLVNEKVKAFSISGHTFVRIESDSTHNTPVAAGFYEKIYEGPITVLEKRVRVVKDYATSQQIETRVQTNEYYYLKKDGIYYPYKNENSFYDLTGNQKKEVQQYLKKNKIKFRKDQANALAKAAAYYDILSK